MRPQWMSRVTLPVVLIAAAAWPVGASASTGFVPSGPSVAGVYHQSAHVSDTAPADQSPVEPQAVIALGLLGLASGTLLVTARTRRRTA